MSLWGWIDSDHKLAEFMHKDLVAAHNKIRSSTPKYFKIPVYTTPQQRKPLTDEWIRSKCNQTWVFDTVKQWVREVEAAHGIK